MNPLTALDTWWESWRASRPHLQLADMTYDQSHSWHALFCALAGSGVWAALGWLAGTSAWAYGVLAAIAWYVVREGWWRARAFAWLLRYGEARAPLPRLHWWDMALDLGKPTWAPGCLALAVLFGDVPWWIIAAFTGLSFAIAYAYSFGRPPGALYYDGKY